MRTRLLDGAIFVWMVGVCLVLTGWRDLNAAPAPPVNCDNKCRHIHIYGVAQKNGPPGAAQYGKMRYEDCKVCANGGGCDDSKAVVAGSCQNTTQDQEVAFVVNGALVCPTIVGGNEYEATGATGSNPIWSPLGRKQKTCQ
jgi:hypothetical protein